jgi:hypothetical protein
MVNIPLNDIEVRAFDAGTLNVGLDYTVLNDALTLNPTGTNLETLTLPYSFKVKAIHPIRLTDNELQLTQATTEGGLFAAVSITETITSLDGEELGMKMVGQNNLGLMELDDIAEFSSQEEISVNTEISLNAMSFGPNNLAVAKIENFKQTFSQTQVPEPNTLLGILVFGGFGLAIKHKQ